MRLVQAAGRGVCRRGIVVSDRNMSCNAGKSDGQRIYHEARLEVYVDGEWRDKAGRVR